MFLKKPSQSMIVMIVYAATFGKEFYEIVMDLKLSSLDIH